MLYSKGKSSSGKSKSGSIKSGSSGIQNYGRGSSSSSRRRRRRSRSRVVAIGTITAETVVGSLNGSWSISGSRKWSSRSGSNCGSNWQ